MATTLPTASSALIQLDHQQYNILQLINHLDSHVKPHRDQEAELARQIEQRNAAGTGEWIALRAAQGGLGTRSGRKTCSR